MSAVISVLSIVVIAGAWWFWLHCARPALADLQVRPRIYRLVLAATILTMVGTTANLVSTFVIGLPEGGSLRWWLWTISGAIWIVIVGLGWPRYAMLRRVLG